MPEQDASVTVTVTQGGARTVYEVPKAVDLKFDVDEVPGFEFHPRGPWELSAPRIIRSITFSMRPIPTGDDGRYATVRTTPLPVEPTLEERMREARSNLHDTLPANHDPAFCGRPERH